MNVKNVEALRDYFCQMRKQLACYVCGKVLSNPWTVRCGHSYCKCCIQHLIYFKRTCPRCVTYPVIHYNIKKNDELDKVITQFKKIEVAFEADTNFSLFEDLFQRSHIAYKMNNLEHSRSTTSLQAQNSPKSSEILQPSVRANKNVVKKTNTTPHFGEAMVNTTPKNAPDRKSTSETEYFRKFRNVTHPKDPIGSDISLEEENVEKDQNLTKEKSRGHPSHEFVLDGSGEDFAGEEEEGEEEQKSVFSDIPTYSSLESDDLQSEEEEVEEKQNLSEESRGHPSHESVLHGSGEDFAGEEEEGEKEQKSVFSDIPTYSSLESDDLQNEEEGMEEEQNLSEEEIRGHPSHESVLDGSGEDFAGEEEGEEEQKSVFSDIPTYSSLESDDLQSEEEEVEEKQNLSEESRGHPSHESVLHGSGEDFAGEEEEGEKEQKSVFSDIPTYSSLESDDLQNEEEEMEEEQNLSEEEIRGHPSHESVLDGSGEDFAFEEDGEKEQKSVFSDTSKHSSLRSLKSLSGEIELPSINKSKRFDRCAESENMVFQSNTETEALEESVVLLESYRKVSQRPRNKKSAIATENSSILIETIESLPNVHNANSPLLLNKSLVNKSTPNFSRRVNNNVRFIKFGRLNKLTRKKVPFYYCGKLSRHYNLLDKDSVTILSPNQMRTNFPKKSPVNRTLLDFGFQTSRENFMPQTSQIEENSHKEKKKRSVSTETSQNLLKIFLKEFKSSKKRKLSTNNSDSEFSDYSGTTELLEDYIKRKKNNVDKGKPELGTTRKRKFPNTEFVNRVENSETRAIERMRNSVHEADIYESFQLEKFFSSDKENQKDPFNISEERAQLVTEEHHNQDGPGIIENSEYVNFSSDEQNP